MKIFVVIPDQYAGCGFYRQYQPHNRLAKTHKDVEFIKGAGVYGMDGEFAVDADILQVHKGYVSIEEIREAQERGITVIGDFDDWWKLDSEHIFYKQYIKDRTTEKLIEFLETVDYVTCTTELLADEVRRYNNATVLPNAMDMNYLNCKIERFKEDKIVFGYVGGHCHAKDISRLHGLNNKLSSYDNYILRLMGVDGSEVYNYYSSVMSDQGRLAGKSFDWIEKANIWNYPKFYNYMDVSLVPLVGNKFNSMKSELKLIEAGFFGKAVIVDNVEPYKGLLRHKENCLVVNKPGDWYKNCKYLLDNPDAIGELGEALRETVRPYEIDTVNEKRYKFYSDVLKERDTNSSIGNSRLQAIHG